MAEKEENTKDIIYVFSQELICKVCKDWYENVDDVDKPKCDYCEGRVDIPHLSRQEAIERMAKAICANEDEYADCKQCEFNGPEDCKRYYRHNWLYTAEAALNALLEGK